MVEGGAGRAWRLAAGMSPRAWARVADVDAGGRALNSYSGRRRLDGGEPGVPWAVCLAGEDGRFRLLAFDLDAKTDVARAAAGRDAGVLAGLLGGVGLPAVVCESGPSGGRHVWTATADGVDAETVAALGRLARHLCPTLDLSPLANPATGCVRPPGSPHRDGGASRVLSGDVSCLTSPRGSAAQVHRLVEVLARLVVGADGPGRGVPAGGLPSDEHGRVYLPGPRRGLPPGSAEALRLDASRADASAVLWRVLLGAAAARWRCADVAALAEGGLPGLEHVRSRREAGRRVPRGSGEAARLLARQWDKAVRRVAAAPRRSGDDPTFDARAGAVAARVRAVQARADASPGRWGRGGGPADRRVLDALCLLALRAVSLVVEADVRRLAVMAGIGRETARTALSRLAAADGRWIAPAGAAAGPRGALWTVGPGPGDGPAGPVRADYSGRIIAGGPAGEEPPEGFPQPCWDNPVTSGPAPPVGAGPAERTVLARLLGSRLADAAHDVFTPRPGLGHLAGNVYARTTTEPQTTTGLGLSAGGSPGRAARALERLAAAGLVERTRDGWSRPPDRAGPLDQSGRLAGASGRAGPPDRAGRLGAAAERLGVGGRLAGREARYRVERELWAWWLAERAWMRAPARGSPGSRPRRGQLALAPEPGTHVYGPHPRRPDGRLDWREARRVVEDERAGRARRPREAPGKPPGKPRARARPGGPAAGRTGAARRRGGDFPSAAEGLFWELTGGAAAVHMDDPADGFEAWLRTRPDLVALARRAAAGGGPDVWRWPGLDRHKDVWASVTAMTAAELAVWSSRGRAIIRAE